MYYICIAVGQADFMPSTQDYRACENEQELRVSVQAAIDEWERDISDNYDHLPAPYWYAHAFRAPSSPQETNWSQRVRIARHSDWVLDIISMTEDEYNREQG